MSRWKWLLPRRTLKGIPAGEFADAGVQRFCPADIHDLIMGGVVWIIRSAPPIIKVIGLEIEQPMRRSLLSEGALIIGAGNPAIVDLELRIFPGWQSERQ